MLCFIAPILKERSINSMLTYKGYSGHFELDFEAEIIFGYVKDIRSVVTFQGDNVAEAKQAFYDSVDDYLEFCQELGKEPDQPNLLEVVLEPA
jgi:predicted HicB family RNase H-like nuclease